MVTTEAFQDPHLETVGWENFLGMTVGQAVLELDMTGYPVVVFKNAAHGGVAVVYRRPDGNIGWVDPRRTSSQNGHGSVNGSAV